MTLPNDKSRSISWNFGSCYSLDGSPTPYHGWFDNLRAMGYDQKTYWTTQRCCTVTLKDTLTCAIGDLPDDSDDRHRGWAGAYIQIQGHRFCNDFVGYKVLRKQVLIYIEQ